MTFPAIDISTKKWISEDLFCYFLDNEYVYSPKESIFLKYYKNHLFCDAEGKVFMCVAKAEMTQKWRNWLRFLPNVWKTKAIYKDTHQVMSIEELRTHVLERLLDLEQDEIIEEWRQDVKKAKSYAQLMLCD